jgi:plasmid stability protein
MVDLRIRRLDDWVAEALRARAKRNGHSLEEELREALRHDVKREKEQLVAEHMEMLKTLRDKYGTFSDSTLLIREDRDARG